MKRILTSAFFLLFCTAVLFSCGGADITSAILSTTATTSNSGTASSPIGTTTTSNSGTTSSPTGTTTTSNSGTTSSPTGTTTPGTGTTKPSVSTTTAQSNTPTTPSIDVNKIISALFARPDPWLFLPEAFAPEAMAISQAPLSNEAYSADFVQVNSFSKKMIGKQFHVVYTTLNHAQTAIGYADLFFDAANTIAQLYQTFLNDNPDNATIFQGEAAGFTFTLNLDGANSTITANNGTVSLILEYDGDQNLRKGFLKLTNGIALRYESSESTLRLAYQMTVSGVGYLTELSFARNEDITLGYLHEYIGTESTSLKTSALIQIDENYTRIICDKRESDDLLISGYQEVYRTQSGEWIGAEVKETVKAVEFDTLWFALPSVSGIQSVKMVEETNGLNSHTVYLNGSQTAFQTKKIGGISLSALSRRYDIEMKEVYFMVAEGTGENITYKTVAAQVPMLFVQTDNLGDLGKDMKAQNTAIFSSEPSISANIITPVTTTFPTLSELFTEVKAQNSYQEIQAYIQGN